MPLSLESRRLRLETFDEVVLTAHYLSWLNDPAVVRFSNQRFRRHTAESARAYLDSFAGTASLFLGVRLAAGGRLIGTMTAICATPSHRGHGTLDRRSNTMGPGVWPRSMDDVDEPSVRAMQNA